MRVLRRIAPFAVLFVLWVPSAGAWTWPVGGAVLQGFTFDHAHPYAAGQHRGIDVAAGQGESVLAPASGVVSFAGTVPSSGKSVTIETPDGLSVTLTHLGSIAVARNAAVSEGGEIGTVGSSGTPEVDGPYVHLGVRTTSDEQGYLDPLGLLPVVALPVTAPAPVPPAPVAAPVEAPAPAASSAPSAASEPPAVGVPPVAVAGPPVASAPPADAAPPAAPALQPVAIAAPAPHDAPPVVVEPPVPAAPVAAPLSEPVAVQAAQPTPEPIASSSPAVGEDGAPRALAFDGHPASWLEPALAPALDARALPGVTFPHLQAPSLRPVGHGATTKTARATKALAPPPIVPALVSAVRSESGTRAATPGPAALSAVLHRRYSLLSLVVVLLAVGGFGAGGLAAARIIRSPSPTSEGAPPVAVSTEDPRRARVAVREWAAPHRPRGGLRRAGRRVRALSPAQGQRRPDGQRNGRARNTGDGVRRQERRIAA